MKTLTIAIGLLAMTAAGSFAASPVPPEAGMLEPHRAVYDVELDSASSASGITAIRGRLVFEFTGSTCEGFTQNMRFVMNITNREGGSTLSDLRSSTWEEPDGGRFRFSVANFDNQQPSETTSGNAARAADGGIEVDLAKPRKTRVSLAEKALFPVQHTIELLKAAIKGQALMSADLYDGSDKGEKVFLTTAAIGHQQIAARETLEKLANVERLSGLKAWPVTIAYFEPGSGRAEGTPVHEMGFKLYENGVIRELSIDYGTLSVKGALSEIEFFPISSCPR